MKKLLFSFVMMLFVHTIYGQTFSIIGKGSSGEKKCSGKIAVSNSYLGNSGNISISEDTWIEPIYYHGCDKSRIDSRTLKYEFVEYWKENRKKEDKIIIIMQKCDIDPNVYFFQVRSNGVIPSATTYKTIKKAI